MQTYQAKMSWYQDHWLHRCPLSINVILRARRGWHGIQGSRDSWGWGYRRDLSSISFALFISSYSLLPTPTSTNLLGDSPVLVPEFLVFGWQRGKFYHRADSPVNAFVWILWINGRMRWSLLWLCGSAPHPATLVPLWRSLQSGFVFYSSPFAQKLQLIWNCFCAVTLFDM